MLMRWHNSRHLLDGLRLNLCIFYLAEMLVYTWRDNLSVSSVRQTTVVHNSAYFMTETVFFRLNLPLASSCMQNFRYAFIYFVSFDHFHVILSYASPLYSHIGFNGCLRFLTCGSQWIDCHLGCLRQERCMPASPISPFWFCHSLALLSPIFVKILFAWICAYIQTPNIYLNVISCYTFIIAL